MTGPDKVSTKEAQRLLNPGAVISVLVTLLYSYPALSFIDLQDRCFDGGGPLLARTDGHRSEDAANYLGASIFVSYIIAALVVTMLLVTSLVRMHQQIPSEKKSAPFQQCLWLFSGLSLLSFSFLSYNMLSFLVYSYLSWSKLHAFAEESLMQSIWTWMTRSTLFFDFGRELVSTQVSLKWVKVALSASMASNFYISFLSQKLNIPDISFYIIVGRILPTSFSVNLFFVAVLLRSHQRPGESSKHSSASAPAGEWLVSALRAEMPLLCSCLYACYLSFLPCSVDQLQFISYVIAARAFLAIPFLIRSEHVSTRPLAQATFVMTVSMIWHGHDILELVVDNEVRYGYAIKAIGIDYLVLSASTIVWNVLDPMTTFNQHKYTNGSIKEEAAETD